MNIPLAFTLSPVRNILSFFPILPLLAKSFHFALPSSSSLLAFTLRDILGGRGGPSVALLGSFRAWFARAGLISAAAEITLECGWWGPGGWEEEKPGDPSALRFRESLLDMGLMSLAVRVSTLP